MDSASRAALVGGLCVESALLPAESAVFRGLNHFARAWHLSASASVPMVVAFHCRLLDFADSLSDASEVLLRGRFGAGFCFPAGAWGSTNLPFAGLEAAIGAFAGTVRRGGVGILPNHWFAARCQEGL